MHLRLKSVVASLVTTGMVAGMLGFIIVPAAQAATPPWEPDPNARGNVVFYDATGHVVTGGSIDDSPVAAFVQAAAPGTLHRQHRHPVRLPRPTRCRNRVLARRADVGRQRLPCFHPE